MDLRLGHERSSHLIIELLWPTHKHTYRVVVGDIGKVARQQLGHFRLAHLDLELALLRNVITLPVSLWVLRWVVQLRGGRSNHQIVGLLVRVAIMRGISSSLFVLSLLGN